MNIDKNNRVITEERVIKTIDNETRLVLVLKTAYDKDDKTYRTSILRACKKENDHGTPAFYLYNISHDVEILHKLPVPRYSVKKLQSIFQKYEHLLNDPYYQSWCLELSC